MLKNKNYKIITIADKIRSYSILFLTLCVLTCIFAIKAGEVYRLSFVFILIFADIAIYYIMTFWVKWIILEKCDFQAHEKSILSLLKQKRYKENVILHTELLVASMALGKYDESRQEIDELRQLDSRLKPVQKLDVQLCYIDYMIAVNEMASLNEELENAENALLKLSGKSERIKQKYQRSIRHRQYLIEERWEDVLELLKKTSKNNMTIYEQVNTAYYRGQCCYHLGRYEEAYHELKFAARYGGNTKYVSLANALIEKIPEKNLYDNKSSVQSKKIIHRIDKSIIFFAFSCLLLILSIGYNRYCSHGNSIEEAYCRRYFYEQDELTIFFQEKIGNNELVILGDGENEAYCLFEETDSDYKIVELFRYDRNLGKNPVGLIGIELTEYQKIVISLEISMVLNAFYKKNNIFNQEDMVYVGICSFPMAEDIVVNGSPVSIEQVIYIDDVAVYLWSVENVDLKTNLQVEYVAE